MSKPITVYVYHDADHGNIEVFSTLVKAKAWAKLQWGHKPRWERSANTWHDLESDYVTISLREIR